MKPLSQLLESLSLFNKESDMNESFKIVSNRINEVNPDEEYYLEKYFPSIYERNTPFLDTLREMGYRWEYHSEEFLESFSLFIDDLVNEEEIMNLMREEIAFIRYNLNEIKDNIHLVS